MEQERERKSTTIDLMFRGECMIEIVGSMFPIGEEIEMPFIKEGEIAISVCSTMRKTIRIYNDNNGPVSFTVTREGSENVLADVVYRHSLQSLFIYGHNKRYRYRDASILSQPNNDRALVKSDIFNIVILNTAFERYGHSCIDVCLGNGSYVGMFFLKTMLHQARFNPEYYLNRGTDVYKEMFDYWQDRQRSLARIAEKSDAIHNDKKVESKNNAGLENILVQEPKANDVENNESNPEIVPADPSMKKIDILEDAGQNDEQMEEKKDFGGLENILVQEPKANDVENNGSNPETVPADPSMKEIDILEDAGQNDEQMEEKKDFGGLENILVQEPKANDVENNESNPETVAADPSMKEIDILGKDN